MSLAEHSGRKSNGDDRPHQNPTVRRLRDSTPPRSSGGHGPTWQQLGWIGSLVVAAVGAAWLVSQQFGDLSREIGEVKSEVQQIHLRLDRMAQQGE